MKIARAAKTKKYLKIAAHLRRQIESGELQPGDRLPSFSQLREQFGFMPNTIDRGLGVLQSENLIVREQGRGVFVAEPPTRASTATIGFLCSNNEHWRPHPYWTELMQGLQEKLVPHGLDLLLLHGAGSVKWEKVDGVAICETWHRDGQTLIRDTWEGATPGWLPPGMPCVSLLSRMEGVASVAIDDYGASREATRFLIEQGHRRIAFLTSLHDPISQERLRGYRDALREARIRPQARWIRRIDADVGEHYIGGGRFAMNDWLQNDWHQLKCSALLTQNDDAAIGAMQALSEAGLKVPDDVSVVGFDGTEVGRHCAPRLTTMEVPLREIGARGAQCLLSQMEQLHLDEKTDAVTLMTARLRVRESTRAT